MEGLAGLGAASCIVSLVDFAVRLTSNVVELARSPDGMLNAHRELGARMTVVRLLSKQIGESHSIDSSQIRSQPVDYASSIQAMARMSEDAADEVLHLIQYMKTRTSTRRLASFCGAFCIGFKSGGINAALSKLNSLQGDLHTFLLAQLRYVNIP